MPLSEEEIKKLVIMRLQTTMPSNIKFSIGSKETFLGASELIDHVRQGDEIGQKIIDLELNFLKKMKTIR